MKNRGIGRGSIFFGGLLLAAAVAVLGTGLLLSPHQSNGEGEVETVRRTVALFQRNSAIGTLVLTALSAYLLFPNPRPRKPTRDRLLLLVIAVLVLASLYLLFWMQFSVLR